MTHGSSRLHISSGALLFVEAAASELVQALIACVSCTQARARTWATAHSQAAAVRAALNQFNKALDKNQASVLFKLLLKYQPEAKAEKKERLLKEAEARADGKVRPRLCPCPCVLVTPSRASSLHRVYTSQACRLCARGTPRPRGAPDGAVLSTTHSASAHVKPFCRVCTPWRAVPTAESALRLCSPRTRILIERTQRERARAGRRQKEADGGEVRAEPRGVAGGGRQGAAGGHRARRRPPRARPLAPPPSASARACPTASSRCARLPPPLRSCRRVRAPQLSRTHSRACETAEACRASLH